LHAVSSAFRSFLVEDIERRQTDVGYLFFTQRHLMVRRIIRRLRFIGCRCNRCRRAPDQRKRQAGRAQGRYGLRHSLLFRCLLRSWHFSNPPSSSKWFEIANSTSRVDHSQDNEEFSVQRNTRKGQEFTLMNGTGDIGYSWSIHHPCCR
jgi:hypothetical protein